MDLIFLFLHLIGYGLPAVVYLAPSRPIRRLAILSNQIEIEPEVVVRIPIRKESYVTERLIGRHCQNGSNSRMSLYKLNGRNAATCNDGSAAGYYLLRQRSSSKWVIFLEGGWYCADEISCKLRKIQEPRLTSSRSWCHCIEGKGIYSVSPRENPHLYNSNMVYIPYCSSDLWSGTAKRRLLGNEPFSFMGSLIIKQVVQQLLENQDMRQASVVVLAGSSAGGTGVFVNLDLVQGYLRSAGSTALVRGVADSAWYLKRDNMERNTPYCSNPFNCSPVSMLKMGMSLWQPNLPQRCIEEQREKRSISPNSSRFFHGYRRDGKWKCFFGPVLFPYIKGDVFIVQFLFDSIQLQSDQMIPIDYHGNKKSLLLYLKNLYDDLNDSFTPVKDWNTLEISHVSLPDAIQCWETNLDSGSEEASNLGSNLHLNTKSPNSVAFQSQLRAQEDQPEGATEERETEFSTDEAVPDNEEGYGNTYYATSYNDAPKFSTTPTQCRKRVIDPCPLPQCNPTCRPVYHRITHVRLSSIEFLENLGIKIRKLARKRGLNASQLLRDLNQI